MGFDLEPTEEQQALRDTLHDFAGSVLRPAARGCEEAGETSARIRSQIHELGVAAPVDEAYGGGGTFDAVTYCMAAEELAWGDPGIAYQVLGSGLAAVLISSAGAEEQKQKYLPMFAGAEPAHTFVAVGEKVAAGDLDSLETDVGDERASGTKYGVLDAGDFGLGIVIGRTGASAGALLVEPGVGIEVLKPEDKLGLRSAPTHVVSFEAEGVALPDGPGLLGALLYTKLLTAAVALGCARACFEYAAQYATEREAFGKPIGAFQAISFKVADMAIEVDAARLALWRAAWLVDRGEAATADVASAVGQVLAAAIRCGDDGVQILGGHGYMVDHPVEMWFRDAVTLSAFDAPDLTGDLMVSRGVFAGGE